ncbi:MAG TPA: prolyl oligopeptidase family serine peptidase [Gemmatimonadaceae bacterium]|nr:prolyl oligopeptidase family serine peptidase [Gemmatimonadaceae bacterium]
MSYRVTALLVLVPALAAAQVAQQGYVQPPAPIAAMLDAEPLPLVQLDPTRQRMLLVRREAMPSIREVGAPFLSLAGSRINPRTNGGWTDPSYTGLVVRDVRSGRERAMRVPAGTRIGTAMWSPDGANVAFTVRTDSAITVWVADASTGAARQLSRARLNAAAGATPCTWATRASLVCRFIPAGRGAAPRTSDVPTGPVIQENEGAATANPTYQDLLRNADDERLFEHYFTTQLAVVGLDGTVRNVGRPGLYMGGAPSPDGKWLLVVSVHRPFSYQVPRFRFPTRTELWTMEGAPVRVLADLPLQDRVGRTFDAVPAGLRSPQWRSDAPATVVWVEALDGGDPSAKLAKHDRVLMLPAPFTGDATTVADLEYRYNGMTWARADMAILYEGWTRTRRERTWMIDPSKPGTAGRVLWDRSSEDRYGDPGSFETTPGPFGRAVLLTSSDGRAAYLTGGGASPEGDRPFLDRYELATGKTERLFRSEAPYYEAPVSLVDREGTKLITRRESVNEPPNYYMRDLAAKSATALTDFKDPAPQFAGVTKELITYKRADGVQLSATLYLPAGYDKAKDGPLPFFFWAYPQEFRSSAAASQVTGSPHRFTRPNGSSHLFLLTQGYGVLDGPTMPIIGENGAEPNDKYVPQLVASAQAAVDEVVRRGVADRERIGVGGHSYGAFMTANLLAHSNIFKAGIARSGAYNRTLTPFGFQAEERNYWQARDVYTTMSPFTFADSVSAPILLIHGAADDNQGTFPVQSERFYAALKGNGKKARLVMLPAEPHGYRARESNGHVLWEMVTWMERHVKKEKPKA